MTDRPVDELDDIDRVILRILARNPRIPYSDIAEELAEEGYEMSSEGIRYRVSNLFDSTSILLLTAPKDHGWEVLRLLVSVENEPGAEREAFERLQEMEFWMACRTMGSSDLYAVATARSNREAHEMVSEVRGLEHVESVEPLIETDRETDISNYLSL